MNSPKLSNRPRQKRFFLARQRRKPTGAVGSLPPDGRTWRKNKKWRAECRPRKPDAATWVSAYATNWCRLPLAPSPRNLGFSGMPSDPETEEAIATCARLRIDASQAGRAFTTLLKAAAWSIPASCPNPRLCQVSFRGVPRPIFYRCHAIRNGLELARLLEDGQEMQVQHASQHSTINTVGMAASPSGSCIQLLSGRV